MGETLFDETRAWGVWADWLGVPRLTLFAVLGGVIERGEDHRRAFEIVSPGIDVDSVAERQREAGTEYRLVEGDLYPDTLPALRQLVEAGFRLAVAANQPVTTEDLIARLDVGFELVASSRGWGLSKPDPRFFARIAEELDLEPREVAYVGDRVDNDVRPAAAAGMAAVHIVRGPWGYAHAAMARAAGAIGQISSLLELPALLRGLDEAASRDQRRPRSP